MKNIAIILSTLLFTTSCEKKNIVKKNETKHTLKDEYLLLGMPKSFSDTLMVASSHPSFLELKKSDSLILQIDYKQKQDSLYKIIDEELDWCETDTMWVNPARNFIVEQQYIYQKEVKHIEESYYHIGGEEFARFAEKTDPNYIKRIKQMTLRRQYEELLLFNYTIRSYITRPLEGGTSYLNRIPKGVGPYNGIHLKDYKNVKKLSSYPKSSQKRN